MTINWPGKSLLFATALILGATSVGVQAVPCGGHGDARSLLVSAQWLAIHRRDPGIVILSVTTEVEYKAGHIPGALFLRYEDTILKKREDLPVELRSLSELSRVFGGLGVTDKSHVIVYAGSSLTVSATRVYLTLDFMGLGSHVSILDGGLRAWQNAGHPVSTAIRPAVPNELAVCQQYDVFADMAYVKSNLHRADVQIVDARDSEIFAGAEIPDGERAGHIPGAHNLPSSKVLSEDGKLKSRSTLETMFSENGLNKGNRIVLYCHVGRRASVIYFVARYLGYDARLYNGSWEEWSRHSDLPTETTCCPPKHK